MIYENNTIKVSEEDKKVLLDLLRPKGKWIEHEKVFECSECQIIRAKGTTGKYNYCPSCGARMDGE